MSIFTALLQKTSSIKYLSFLFIGSHLILLAMVSFIFPVINKQIGATAFDLQTFGYSQSTAETIVNNLNDQTIQLYLFPQLTFLDVLYPLLLALFLSSVLFRFIKADSKLGLLLIIIPFLAMLFDYSENICIILMITKTMALSKSLVFIASIFTVLKGLFTSIAWVAILAYSIKWCVLKIKRKLTSQPLVKT